jgi:Flp pilus assembly protein TadG
MKAPRQNFFSDQSGAMAVMAAILLIVLLAASALAVDYGYMAWVQSELEKAAEAGALAGARVLGSVANPSWSTGQAAATAIVQQNKVEGKLLTDCQVDYGYWSKLTHTLQPYTITPQKTDDPAIQVTIQKASGQNGGPVRLLFAPIFGVKSFDLKARAVAKLNSSSGLWSILETGNGTVTINNNANVQRDVGICGAGSTTVNNNATVQGGVYLSKNAPQPSIGNNAVVQDGIKQDDSAAASLQAASQAATTAYNSFVGPASNLGKTIANVTATTTLPVGKAGANYLSVTNFTPSNNAIITINAPTGSSYVIRISNNFTLNNNSQIKLTGGITSDGVTFVNTGTKTATLSNNSILYGSILSPNGAITVNNNATIKDGVLVSSKNISLNNNSLSTTKTPWLTPSGGSQGASLVQ